VDIVWLALLAAVGTFVLRTLLIARKLKQAAKEPHAADLQALREAKQALRVHRDLLEDAVARPKEHLAAAKRLSRLPPLRARSPPSGVDAMVEDFLPERRL
jgi:hypothetical protein